MTPAPAGHTVLTPRLPLRRLTRILTRLWLTSAPVVAFAVAASAPPDADQPGLRLDRQLAHALPQREPAVPGKHQPKIEAALNGQALNESPDAAHLQLRASSTLRLAAAAPAPPAPDRPAIPAAALLPPAPLPLPGPRPSPAARTAAALPKDLPEVLLLDVRINSQRLSDVVRVEQTPGGNLLLPTDAWLEARLAPGQAHTMSDGTPAFALNAVSGASYSINRQGLSMDIQAPATAFTGSTLGPKGHKITAPERPAPGMILNYDTSVQRDAGGKTSAGAFVEVVAFGRLGSFVSSAVLRADGSQRSLERLDTFWRYDIPEQMESIVAGDTVGVSGGWSRPARYGGFRYGRDFGQSPGFVTLPQLSLNGSAALPSVVEVLVNNERRISQQVQPGPFELSNVPLTTGGGELNLVVRDLLGRQTVVQQSYYASPRLLAPGLTDFSVEGGKLRNGFGVSSTYGDAFGAVTWRQGLTTSLTGEARVEVQAARRAAGIELVSLLGTWGVGRMALAASSGRTQGTQEKGHLLQLGIERNTPLGGGALQYDRASQGFAPFGEGRGTNVAAMRSRDRLLATVGGNLWGTVSGGINYVSQRQWTGDSVKSIGVATSAPLWNKASVSLSVNRRLDGDRAWRAGLVVSMPLDNGIYTSARMSQASGGAPVANLSAARNAPAGPGLGWRVEGSSQDSQRARGGLQVNASFSEFAADAESDARGKIALRGSARGTLGMLSGLPFASRPVGHGSFAVVEVDGLAGVPVLRSHQVVATTDASGRAFIPGLLPWQKNQIEIDPTDLPLDTEVGETTRQITPYASSGAVVKFAVRRTRQALVVLHQADGSAVPAGARVTLLPGGGEFIAGLRGEVWLTDLAAAQQRVRVVWPGGNCELDLTVPESSTPPKIGPVTCGKTDHALPK